MPRNNDLLHRLSDFIGLDCIGLGRGYQDQNNPRIGTACIGGSAGPREIGSDRIGNTKTWIGTVLVCWYIREQEIDTCTVHVVSSIVCQLVRDLLSSVKEG